MSTPSTLHAMTDPIQGLQRIVTNRASLSVQVAERTQGPHLRGGALLPGRRLPTEAEFERQLPSAWPYDLREALKQLENDGLIQVKRGLGRLVCRAGAAPACAHPPSKA